MLDWWNWLQSLEIDAIALLSLVVTIIGVLLSWYTINKPTKQKTISQKTSHGDNVAGNKIVQGDNVARDKIINNIGITLEQYENGLKKREVEVHAKLEKSHAEDRKLLKSELRSIENALQDTKASYEALISSLEERIARLEAQRGEWPEDILDKAIVALRNGDIETADCLFQQVEEDSGKHIKLAFEAAFQRGKIAEDQIRYGDALKHYENAVRLQPDNVLYLNATGSLHITLANYRKAIEYFELALASDLKTYGENHSQVAIYRNNLGLALRSQAALKSLSE